MTHATRPDRPSTADRAGPLGIAAWCLYDWANTAFFSLMGTFIFASYYVTGIFGDGPGSAEPRGATAWASLNAAAGIATLLLTPIVAAVAARTGRWMVWLFVMTLLTSLATAALWFAEPRPEVALWAGLVFAVALVSAEVSSVLYAALLPGLVPEARFGRVSGWAFGLGYLGVLAAMLAALVLCVGLGDAPGLLGIPTEEAQHVRATFVLAGAWFLVFALPMFLFTPDKPATGVPFGRAIGDGLVTLIATIRGLRQVPDLARFLLVSVLYRDGLSTVFVVGGAFAAARFGLATSDLILFALGLSLAAAIGSLVLSFVDDWLGSRRTIALGIGGFVAFGAPTAVADSFVEFSVCAHLMGLFLGPIQSSSRALLARMTPPDREAEIFGLYALTGRAANVVGPTLFALATWLAGDQRAGLGLIVLQVLLGGLLLLTVRGATHPARRGEADPAPVVAAPRPTAGAVAARGGA